MFKDDPNSFIQTYPKEIEEDVLYFLHTFIWDILDTYKNELLFFVILDNASSMDRASWVFFNLIYQECPQMVLIFCLQSFGKSVTPKNTGKKP